ncbi:MAG: mandelate racemase/muconate lactonizing enzyme family protein [Acidiferrobacterales bacterium]
MPVECVTISRLKVPLKTPYKLSLAEIRAFDTVLVEARNGDGRIGLGEATVLTGYTHETIDQCWELAAELAQRIIGRPFEDAKAIADESRHRAPFTVTAVVTAIEMLQGSSFLTRSAPERVPLLALVHSTDADGLSREIDTLIEQHYATLKVKVGFDVESDLTRVRLIQQLVDGRARLRIDANQGYNRDDARHFAKSLNPEGIELLEQTCAAGDWKAAQAVAEVADVPLMLDESIYDLSDVDRAADLGVAQYIKFKLMKAGGLADLAKALDHIRACGMEPVLGNGVACDVGCWMEACMMPGYVNNAGEMNGFLKTRSPLFQEPLIVEHDAIKLEPAFVPKLDQAMITQYTEATQQFGSQ